MAPATTNFAYLMDLLGISTSSLCTAIGSDKTLVCRWRSGKRKLMAGHHWPKELAAYFVRIDQQLKHPVLFDILRVYYPSLPLDSGDETCRVLALWLTNAAQRTEEYRQERHGMLGFLMGKNPSAKREAKPIVIPPIPMLPDLNKATFGMEGFHVSVMTFLGLVLALPEPQEILFICPDGLEMITREEKFAAMVMDKLIELFDKGHTFSVVIRTDYKISDIAAFSGRWLVAHLLGYVKSYYYDDFKNGHTEKMLASVKGHMAVRVVDGEAEGANGIYTTMHFDETTVEEVYEQCDTLRAKAKQRFHYSLFEKPNSFLKGIVIPVDEVSYLYSRLPHFGIAPKEEIPTMFHLTDMERKRVFQHFSPLFTSPAYFGDNVPIRHIFCEDDIELTLLKSTHVCHELSTICSRKILMKTECFVEQLVRIKAFLGENKNYEVCFLPKNIFEKFVMQIGVWGQSCTIGWVTSGKSTASKDFQSVAALHGFCVMVWDKIPAPMRSRTVANQKLNLWLKKAAKYGYKV